MPGAEKSSGGTFIIRNDQPIIIAGGGDGIGGESHRPGGDSFTSTGSFVSSVVNNDSDGKVIITLIN